MTPEEAEIRVDAIERAIIDAAMSEALYQGVGAQFILEALDRTDLWVRSNLTKRYENVA
jgi:hypothetical protein